MSVVLTTVAACRVARMDRQRLNEIISAGDYPIAPDTIPGRSRMFSEIDIIGLFILAREIERGTRLSHAGRIVWEVVHALRENPQAGEVHVAVSTLSGGFKRVEKAGTAGAFDANGIEVYEVRSYNVAYVRKLVREGIAAEMNVVGEPGE